MVAISTSGSDFSRFGLKPYGFIEALRSLNFVEAIYLYGSRARGNYRPHSDIDIALKLHDNKPNYRHIIADIVENADTLLAIDCVNIDEAPEALKKQIAKEGVLLFENKYDDIPF